MSPQVLLTWTPSLFYLRHEGDVYDALPNNPMEIDSIDPNILKVRASYYTNA